MLDIDKAWGTLGNAASPPIGTASGALGAGLLVAYLPDPTRLVYIVLLAILIVQAVGVALIGETSPRAPGAQASLRPRVALPAKTRRPMLIAAPALVAGWALAGFYGSLGPAVIARLTGSHSPALGGLVLFILAASAALAVPVLRSTPPRSVMLIGTVALLTGVATTLVATTTSSVALFLAGTAIAGVGFGGCFQGAIRAIAPLAASDERAGVLSIIYLVSYIALGLPVIGAGVLVVHGSGILSTSREYGATIMLLAALAMLGLILQRRSPRRRRGPIDDPPQSATAACVSTTATAAPDPKLNVLRCLSGARVTREAQLAGAGVRWPL
jgi:hypothetical protein